MPFKKYNSANNAFATLAVPLSDTDTTMILKWKYSRMPTSNFIVKITKTVSWVVTARENIYVTTRTWTTCTWLSRAYEPVPIDDDATSNIQQALNFDTDDVVEVVISSSFIEDIQNMLKESINIDDSNLNTLFDGWFYDGDNLTNSPDWWVWRWYITVQQSSVLDATTQRAVSITDTGLSTYERIYVASAWWVWKQTYPASPNIHWLTWATSWSNSDEFVFYSATAWDNRKITRPNMKIAINPTQAMSSLTSSSTWSANAWTYWTSVYSERWNINYSISVSTWWTSWGSNPIAKVQWSRDNSTWNDLDSVTCSFFNQAASNSKVWWFVDWWMYVRTATLAYPSYSTASASITITT